MSAKALRCSRSSETSGAVTGCPCEPLTRRSFLVTARCSRSTRSASRQASSTRTRLCGSPEKSNSVWSSVHSALPRRPSPFGALGTLLRSGTFPPPFLSSPETAIYPLICGFGENANFQSGIGSCGRITDRSACGGRGVPPGVPRSVQQPPHKAPTPRTPVQPAPVRRPSAARTREVRGSPRTRTARHNLNRCAVSPTCALTC